MHCIKIEHPTLGHYYQNGSPPNTDLLPKNLCTSLARVSGSSFAAKWPPCENVLYCCRLNVDFTQFWGGL